MNALVKPSRDTVDGYIERRNAVDELTSWNIAVISRREKILGEIDLGLPRKVNLIGRSKRTWKCL